jgi:glycosyltransferase involved in cell wall biosynthesis
MKERMQSSEICVSVVVPAYKIAGEIDRCLETLATQTLTGLEVLVVNDGSPDDTAARARVWETKFPGRIRVIDKPNGGCASARAEGLRQARGDFVGFVDGDDWVAPEMFAALYAAAAAAQADIAQCGYCEAFSDGSHIVADESFLLNGDAPHVISDMTRLLPLRPTIWRRIYRRSFLADHDIRFAEHIRCYDDLPFQFETFARATRVAIVPGVHYFYRQDRPGQDIAARNEKLFVHFELFDWLAQRMRSHSNPMLDQQLLRVELNSHLWALSRIEERLKADYLRRTFAHLDRPRAYIGSRDKFSVARSINKAACWLVLGSLLHAPLRLFLRPSARGDG